MPDKSVLLHIGYPKTATTWFQIMFFPKVQNFSFLRFNDLPKWIFQNSSEINPSDLANFRQSLEQLNVIISAEQMVGNISNMYLNPKKYKEIFPNAQVLVLLREQIDKFASNYSHHILMGGTCSVNEFLFPLENKELFNGQKHKYDQLLDCYKKEFGADRIHVYLFEEFKSNPKEFIMKLIDKFNLDLNITLEDIHATQNIRLTRQGIKIMRGLNLFTKSIPPYHRKSDIPKRYLIHIPYWNQLSRRWIYFLNRNNILGGRYNSEELLGEDNVLFLKKYFAESNRKLIENHNLEQIRKFKYAI
jgi:hypothetical protein